MPDIESPRLPNIRSESYFIATTEARCWHCNRSTTVIALAVPDGHEILVGDEDVDTWDRATGDALIFYVGRLSVSVQTKLTEVSPLFRRAASLVTLDCYWANHCESCGKLLEDHELHCEPDGPFSPSSEEASARIHLLSVHEPFEASSAGYSPNQSFASFMRRT